MEKEGWAKRKNASYRKPTCRLKQDAYRGQKTAGDDPSLYTCETVSTAELRRVGNGTFSLYPKPQIPHHNRSGSSPTLRATQGANQLPWASCFVWAKKERREAVALCFDQGCGKSGYLARVDPPNGAGCKCGARVWGMVMFWEGPLLECCGASGVCAW